MVAGAVFAGGLAVFGAGFVPCADRGSREEKRERGREGTCAKAEYSCAAPCEQMASLDTAELDDAGRSDEYEYTGRSAERRRSRIPPWPSRRHQATKASVSAFINAIEDDQKREDCKTLVSMMNKATKAKPVMWGPAIVGFGDHDYYGASGKPTKWFEVGFSPRKAALSLYLMGGKDAKLLAKLGPQFDGRRLPVHQAPRRRAHADAAETDRHVGEANPREQRNKKGALTSAPFVTFDRVALLPLRDIQLTKLRDHVGTRRRRLHGVVDVEDLSVGCDVERPSPREARRPEHAVLGGDFFRDVAEDWVVRFVHLGELLVVLGCVDANHVVRDVVLPNQIAALTERLAFGRSTTGERLREPREHDCLLAARLRQRVSLAVRSRRRERGGHVTNLQFHGGCLGHRARRHQTQRRAHARP